jgi:hypothetical protein
MSTWLEGLFDFSFLASTQEKSILLKTVTQRYILNTLIVYFSSKQIPKHSGFNLRYSNIYGG